MNVQSYLDQNGINYRMSKHETAYTAQDLASKEHVPGRQVIKPVVVKASDEFVMCALPASHKVDLAELRQQLGTDDVRLAEEEDLEKLFPDCELGAEPPIGRIYGMPTLMDESLFQDKMVTFQAGTHCDAVTMSLSDFRRIARAEVAYFGRHM